jgi:P27 family predicted phage terminase small subunit
LQVLPAPPDWLNDTARKWFVETGSDLVGRRWLTPGDLTLLEAAALSYALARRAQEQLDVEGLVVMTDRGPRKHPSLPTLERALSELRLQLSALGLSPTSREWVSVAPTARPGDSALQYLDDPDDLFS